MKARLGIALVLVFAPLAYAQFTTVIGTVVDPHNVPYALGTITPTLVANGTPTLNGFAYTPPTQPVGLDKNGFFSFNIADNTQLQPAGSKWNFIVCSAVGTTQPAVGTGSQCFTLSSPLTISGAMQNISTQLNAAALALTIPIGTGGGNIVPGTANSQFPTWVPGLSAWEPQNKAVYDTRDWMTCDGSTDATAGMALLVSTIGTQNAIIRVIGTTTPTASCVVTFAHSGSNITLDFSGGGALQLLTVVTPPGGGAFVQGGGQSNNPSSSTCSVTLPGVVAGHSIVMMVALYNTFGNSRILNISDGKDFYIQQQATTIGQAAYEALYVAPSIAGGNTTVTANFSGTATKNACIAWEISGLGPVPKIDAGNFQYGTTTPFNSGAATLGAGDLVIGYSEDPNDAQTCTQGAGYTQPAGSAGNIAGGGGSPVSLCAEYIASGAGGSTTATQNFSSSPVASSYVSAIIGLKPGIATVIPQGGILDPDGHQIFINATGTNGIVDFTGNLASFEVHPEWWGASNNATAAVNTPAMQAAIVGAFGCGPTTCRVNGSGLGIYNKTLRLTGQYQINAELQMYHVIGQSGARNLIACDGGGIIQTGTNLRIFDGQSDAYLNIERCSFTGNATSTNALIDWDYTGAQGIDLAPQFIDHKENTFIGNSQVDVGVLIAKSGGGAQGSNIYCHDCESIGFTGAAWQVGGDNTGRNVGRFPANNALAIGYDGDMQGNPLYGFANYGGGYISFGGGSRLSSMENGFATQTGFDIFSSISQGPFASEHVRSESRRIAFCSTCQLKDYFAINQSCRPNPATSNPVGTVCSGNQVTGDGAYYKVTVDAANWGGVGTPAAPVLASSGTSSSITNTNQTLNGSVTVKTFPGASLNETMTQAVTGATGVRLSSPANNATITGTASGAQIILNETMTQAVTGVTCTEQPTTPATGTTQPLICNNFSGTADNSHAWTGGTSGGVYTPSAAPSFAAASPVLLLGSVGGAPDSTHIWTGGTSGGVYTPTQAPQPANYTVNAFTGMLVGIMSGTGALCYGTVASNTATTITISGGWITKYPQTTCPAPDGTSNFVVEPGWNHGTVTSGGITLQYMNETVIDGDNGAEGRFEDVIGYGGQWHLGASPSQRTIIKHGQVSRQDWYTPANATPRGTFDLTLQEGSFVDGDWDVGVYPPGATQAQSWTNLTIGAGATTYLGAAHENFGIRALCWNAASSSQSANEVCVGGRSDYQAGTDPTRNIFEINSMIGRGAPVPNAVNGYNLTNLAGTDTDITGGPSTGNALGGGINFWITQPGGSGTTVRSSTNHARVNPTIGFTSSRFDTNFATTLVPGDFTLGAGWGATAATAITVATSKDQANVTTITTGGAGIAINPTYQITFHDGTWTQTPVCEARQTGGNDILAQLTVTARSATSYTFQWNGTPTTGKTYEITISCWGT
jgi:hypothetical protein